MSSDTRLTTGQMDFSYGVDSSKPPLVASASNPTGLPRNALAWATNATVRGGGVSPRFGLQPLCSVDSSGAIYQGGFIYDQSMLPAQGNPYLMLSIGGKMLQVRVDTDNSVNDVTNGFNDPSNVAKAYFEQGEQFLVKQAGDGVTLPLFWDGTTLRRSNGASASVGVVHTAFNIPAEGSDVLVTLTAPFSGITNQILNVNYQGMFVEFIQLVPGNFVTLQNQGHANTGDIIPAGTQIYAGNTLVGSLLAPIVAPAIGSTVTGFISPVYTGGGSYVGTTILGELWNIKSLTVTNPTANQVYLLNITAPPSSGAQIAANSTLYSVQELPAATAMKYYQGRLWYAQNRVYTAGDIVDGPSGTVPYENTDSILKVTENPLAVGGDGFSVPGNAGNIEGFGIPIALDQTLGQGPLFVFTRKQIYALTVPQTRAQWIAAGANNQPLQVVVMNGVGTASDRSIVPFNSDLFFTTPVPSITSYLMALRYFQTWGNKSSISNNINRALQFENRALMNVSRNIEFNNYLLCAILPTATAVGTAFTSLAILDADPVSTLQTQNAPAWQGVWQGANILDLFEGDFGGLQRAFAVVQAANGSIQVWEITYNEQSDNANGSSLTTTDKRIQWIVETPAFDFSEYPAARGGGPFSVKEIDGLDLWLDSIWGEVLIKAEFSPDEDACFYPWFTTTVCSARNSTESVDNPIPYPVQPMSEGYQMPLSAPKPTNSDCSIGNQRPVTQAYKFRLRFTFTGWCRIRGYHLHVQPRDTTPFYRMIEC